MLRGTGRARTSVRALRASIACALALGCGGAGAALAKTPGSLNCYKSICYTVLSLEQTAEAVGVVQEAVASFYDDPRRDRFNPRRRTSSGEMFDWKTPDNVASPIYPDGTELLVWNPDNGVAAHVRVNNNGPFHSDRTLDCSRGLAERMGFLEAGIARLKVVVVAAPTPELARYERNRTYPRLAGYLGTFASLEQAAIGTRVGHLVTAAGPELVSLSTTGAVASPPTELTQHAVEPTSLEESRKSASAHRSVASRKARKVKSVRRHKPAKPAQETPVYRAGRSCPAGGVWPACALS